MPDTFEEKTGEQDYYQLLGVRRHASFDEVKKAYRALAQKYHPDHGSADSVGRFVQINTAYETLVDPILRNEYNKTMGYEHAAIAEAEEPQAQGPETEEGKKGVSIDGRLVDSEDRWDALRGKLEAHDLRVSHKAALADPTEIAADPAAEDEISPWGDEREKGKTKRFSLANLLGNRRRDETSKRRTERKEQFRQEIEDRLHPREPLVKSPPKRPTAPQAEEKSFGHSGFDQRGSRIFQFYISSLDRFLGTNRELVLPGSRTDEIRRIKVHVPPGTAPGTVMEISRGWERFNVRIDIQPDLYYAVSGADLLVNIPITVGEALAGTNIEIATMDGTARVQIPAMFHFGNDIRVEGKGVEIAKNQRGALVAFPFIVPPTNITAMLKEAVQVFADQYRGQSVRPSFPARLEEVSYIRPWDVCTAFPVPVTLPEAIAGCSLEIPTGTGRRAVTIVGPWKLENLIVLEKMGLEFSPEFGPGELMIFPQIILPEALSNESFAASVTIDQHYSQPVRAGMPRRLKHAEEDRPKGKTK